MKQAGVILLGLLVLAGIVYFVKQRENPPPPAPSVVTDTKPAQPRRSVIPPRVEPKRETIDTPTPIRQDAVQAPASRLRLMAANLTSGRSQNYDAGHGKRILQGAKPDVVMIQEFNYRRNTRTELQRFADQVMGAPAHYYREAEAQVPNGIISRYPIIAKGEWNDPHAGNRDFAWARIDIPEPTDLWVVSVHLLTSKSTARTAEAETLVGRLNDVVPAAAYIAIGGDFNTSTKSEACYRTLAQQVVVTGPYPADGNGNSNTNATRNKDYDGILVDPDLQRLAIPVTVGSRSFPHGLVLDPRVFRPLSAIAPAAASDGAAAGMQHMAVIRDFRLPASAR